MLSKCDQLQFTSSTPAQMGAYAKSERDKWAKEIRASNIRMNRTKDR